MSLKNYVYRVRLPASPRLSLTNNVFLYILSLVFQAQSSNLLDKKNRSKGRFFDAFPLSLRKHVVPRQSHHNANQFI